MGVRGRKSSAELTVVQRAAQVSVIRRPEPPEWLSDAAAAEWREVVGTFEADHFNRALHPILEAYCEHAVARRKIGQMLQEAEAESEGETPSAGYYDRLLMMHEREGRALGSLAVRLRMASATHIYGPKPTAATRKPWER